jgi:hypothetical protein
MPEPVPIISYATPAGTEMAGGIWRVGSNLVVPNGGTLPPSCVKCNVPVAQPPRLKTYHWYPQIMVLLVVLNPVIFGVIALFFRKKGEVRVSVCKHHRRRRITCAVSAALLAIASIVTIVIGALSQNANVLVLVWLVALVIAIVLAFVSRELYPTRIKKNVLWLKGASPAFLAEIPVAPWSS